MSVRHPVGRVTGQESAWRRTDRSPLHFLWGDERDQSVSTGCRSSSDRIPSHSPCDDLPLRARVLPGLVLTAVGCTFSCHMVPGSKTEYHPGQYRQMVGSSGQKHDPRLKTDAGLTCAGHVFLAYTYCAGSIHHPFTTSQVVETQQSKWLLGKLKRKAARHGRGKHTDGLCSGTPWLTWGGCATAAS
jgi:hypothetical protein